MRPESEQGDMYIREALGRLKQLAVGDEELSVTLDGKDVDVGERVFDELRDVRDSAGIQAAHELAAQFREYLKDMEDVKDEYPSIAAALKGIETFEQEVAHHY